MTHEPYVHVAYPAMRYHATLPPVQVESPEEDDALGDDWKPSPAHFCPHDDFAQPGDTHCPKCALALPGEPKPPAEHVAVPHAAPHAAPHAKPAHKRR